jgi:FkbM family methyltransferase
MGRPTTACACGQQLQVVVAGRPPGHRLHARGRAQGRSSFTGSLARSARPDAPSSASVAPRGCNPSAEPSPARSRTFGRGRLPAASLRGLWRAAGPPEAGGVLGQVPGCAQPAPSNPVPGDARPGAPGIAREGAPAPGGGLAMRGFTLRRIVKGAARQLGYEIRRLPPSAAPTPAKRPFAETAAKILGESIATVLDVGARWAVDDWTANWYRIPPLGRLVGFEPDAVECARLNAGAGPGQRFVPLALGGTTGRRTLHLTHDPACASLYPPARIIDRLVWHSLMQKTGETEIPTIRLDEWARTANEPPIIFMKLDAQGAELEILQGAGEVLDGCLGLQVEVEFSALYEDQPLFADVDQFLRARGFSLWRLPLLAYCTERVLSNLSRSETHFFSGIPTVMAAGAGRLLVADAVYFRDYQTLEQSPAGVRAALLLASLLDAAEEHDGRDACLRHLHTVLRAWLSEAQLQALAETPGTRS